MEENLGQAVFRSKMKEVGLSVACLHPTGPTLPSTAPLCRCPLKAPAPKSAVAQKLLFKNLVSLCYEQCQMRKFPFWVSYCVEQLILDMNLSQIGC